MLNEYYSLNTKLQLINPIVQFWLCHTAHHGMVKVEWRHLLGSVRIAARFCFEEAMVGTRWAILSLPA